MLIGLDTVRLSKLNANIESEGLSVEKQVSRRRVLVNQDMDVMAAPLLVEVETNLS